jgi:hypothetical protein
VYDAAGNVVSVTQSPSSSTGPISVQGEPPLVTTYAYDAQGNLTQEVDNAGGTDATANRTTTTVYTYGTTNTATTTNPDGSTSIETDYLDGSVASIGGTSQVPTSYSYGVIADGTPRSTPTIRRPK